MVTVYGDVWVRAHLTPAEKHHVLRSALGDVGRRAVAVNYTPKVRPGGVHMSVQA